MYVRTIKRKNKNGSIVEYIQLAHNSRHPEKGYSRADVLYSFGRSDQLDVDAIKRLINSLSRFLSPEDVMELEAHANDLTFVNSRPAGGAYILKAFWENLKIGKFIDAELEDRSIEFPVEHALFAMVVNRALAPSSKLAIEEWVEKDVYLCKDEPIIVHHLYRAMDFLLDFQDKFQKDVYWSTANLFNLKVDLIFFDTTNIYFETEDIEDTDLKAYGKSKEKRNDLPLVTIGLAVTREGIPVRCWVLPGNQSDAKVVDQVQKDLNSWELGRIVWVMDRGMTSDQNKIILQKAGGHYILGEKLRGTLLNEKALNRGGRFKVVEDNLHIKEVVVGEGGGTVSRRYVIVYNPQQAVRDRKGRDRLLKRLDAEIEKVNKMPENKKVKAKGKLFNHISMNRYIKELKNGQLRINKAKVKKEQSLDGKYLLSTSDDSLPAEDVAYGYKQLLEVERAFRTLKSTLDLRPVNHTKDERIRTHVLLCWMALLLVRLIEKETGMTWENIRNEMQRLCLGKFSNKNGHILQHTELTKKQLNILKKLKIKPPKKVLSVDITT